MTLVVAVIYKTTGVILSDTLASTEEPQESIVDIPSINAQYINYPDHRYVARLVQKAVIFDGRSVIAWAGSGARAAEAIKVLLSGLTSTSTADDIDKLLRPIIEARPTDQFLYASLDMPKRYIDRNAKVVVFAELELSFHILGSGTEAFCNWLEVTMPHMREALANPPMDSHRMALYIAFTFGAWALRDQAETGHGLAERWGGVFEYTLISGDGIRKVDKVYTAHLNYFPDEKDKPLRSTIGSTYQRYKSERLEVFSAFPSRGVTHLIESPISGAPPEPNFEEEPLYVLADINLIPDGEMLYRHLLVHEGARKEEAGVIVKVENGDIFLTRNTDFLLNFADQAETFYHARRERLRGANPPKRGKRRSRRLRGALKGKN